MDKSGQNGKGILDGVVILDLTRVLAGPYCGMLLADMGATVIKVENPKGGDDTRVMGPFVKETSAYYVNYNRSKLGCTLNLKDPEGKEMFREMVKKADVLLENYRPGTMDKLGLGYEELHKINPRLVYGAISGFGQTGPSRYQPGYDLISQAVGGFMAVTGWPGGLPTKAGTPIGDVLGGLNLAVGVLAALVGRERTGEGEMVDIALTDSMVSAMENVTMIYQSTGKVPELIGNRDETTCPYDGFIAKDGNVVIATANDKLFRILCQAIGQPELAEDPRFQTVPDRVTNHDALIDILSVWTKAHTVDEIVEILQAAGCPVGPVNTLDKITHDPQIAGDRKMFPEIDQPGVGKMQITATPQKFSKSVTKPQKAAPLLGEDNAAIYGAMLGYDGEKLDELRKKGVI